MSDKFEEYRGLIDEVDDQIIDLLKHRYELTLLLHHYKEQNYIVPTADIKRGNEVVAKYQEKLGPELGFEIGYAITGDEEP